MGASWDTCSSVLYQPCALGPVGWGLGLSCSPGVGSRHKLTAWFLCGHMQSCVLAPLEPWVPAGQDLGGLFLWAKVKAVHQCGARPSWCPGTEPWGLICREGYRLGP